MSPWRPGQDDALDPYTMVKVPPPLRVTLDTVIVCPAVLTVPVDDVV